MSDDYEVGYKKPPKHTRFKEGRSGNPKGRPKGGRNFSTDLKDTLEEPVRLTKGGRPKTVSTRHAALLQLRAKALGGETRALDLIIKLAQAHNDEDMAEAAAKLGLTDDEVLEGYKARVLRRAEKARPDDPDDARNGAAQGGEAAPDNRGAPEEDDDAWPR